MAAGAGLALSAGLLMGAAMRPDLGADERPAGPQIVEAASARSSGPFDNDGATLAAYSGKVPDYVVGTDWTKPAKPAAVPPPRDLKSDVSYAEVAYYERPDMGLPDRSAIAAAKAVTRAAEPEPPPAQIDSEAPPEATGDTTVER